MSDAGKKAKKPAAKKVKAVAKPEEAKHAEETGPEKTLADKAEEKPTGSS